MPHPNRRNAIAPRGRGCLKSRKVYIRSPNLTPDSALILSRRMIRGGVTSHFGVVSVQGKCAAMSVFTHWASTPERLLGVFGQPVSLEIYWKNIEPHKGW